ncbi:MAG TPA: SRPBCC domain-containing protein [Chloroflexota bacterium]|jgi:uncharacterized protein YndB with AHSA1/START domain|nr:SRPBCC domain-containing protein [Chloroflexota bacterium]
MTSTDTKTVQVNRVYIKATPQAIWDAITQPEWTVKYGYAPLVDFQLRKGGKFQAHPNEGMKAMGINHVISEGEVLECEPPRRLVHTYHMTMDDATAAEATTTLTYDIQPVRGGVTRLTVTHDLTGAPVFAAVSAGHAEDQGAGGGWAEILSGLKTLLETGEQLPFQSGPANL